MLIKNILYILLTAAAVSYAGLINVNPDPEGEQWIAGGLKIPENIKRSDIVFIKPGLEKSKELPSRVDNSLHKYFRPVFNQVGGSCSQAAGVGYTFTYEMNRLRDLPSDTPDTQYPTHFTYNFLNEGSGEIGSWWGDGWDIIHSAGIMNVTEYGGHFAAGGNSRWISGIAEWQSGHSNRVASYSAIDVGTPEGLNTLKHWLDNHLEDSPYGGLAVFAAGATGYHERSLPEGTHEAGKKVITKWGPDVNHAMTYVGYDDSVRFDYNGDGRFTNDIDINGDRVIDMRDWEIGAVIVANSWGESFGDGGFIYQMYKLLAEPYQNGGIFWSFCDIVHPAAVCQNRYILEIKMKHDRRNIYRISAGSSNDLYAQEPGYSTSFPFMNYQGGDYYPQGGRSEADKYIEFSFDIDDIIPEPDSNSPFKFFFIIDETDTGNRYDGEIISAVVKDNLSGREYYLTDGPDPVINNSRTYRSVIVDENTFVPENLIAFAGDGIVRLEWSSPVTKTSAFESYTVYRNGQAVLAGSTGPEFTDENVSNGILYTYKVSAKFTGYYHDEIFSYPVQALPSAPSDLPYFTDFEDGTDGWLIKGDLSGWLTGNTDYNSEFCDYSGNPSTFILANPDLAGNDIVVRDYAISPMFSISRYNSVTLEFDYILNNYSDLYYFCDISVMYRTGADQGWCLLEKLPYSQYWTGKVIEVPYEAVSSNYTQFAFFIDDYYKWSMGGGGIDNVRITGDFQTFAPVISAYMPADTSFSISGLEPVEFSVEVDDKDTGISFLEFEWYVNDLKADCIKPRFSQIFGTAGGYEVSVVVSDGTDQVSQTWNVTQTGISENLPASTRLYQNYPNPFNPSTVIRFDNAKENFTSLSIYNSNGQKVRTLLNSKLGPGSYSVTWDGRDGKGTAMSSGVYYYTVSSGDYARTYKMMLFK